MQVVVPLEMSVEDVEITDDVLHVEEA